ncbi:ninja-family protein AFP3-like [Typha latifolia]|uniref:ninja-family protein AFP3-like n=1 Tax=Typha latifolia TaxID=4733 RepID=UPI003C2D36C5
MMEEETMEGNKRCSKDLLQRFASNSCSDVRPETTDVDSDEIELSLGLSLGGCYGVDPNGKKMVRSSSIASLLPFRGGGGSEFWGTASSLARTSSLPAEAEEMMMMRKRKEMQSLKRLEAKRKRSERRNSIKSGLAKEKTDEEMDSEQNSGCLRLLGGNRIGGRMNCIHPNGLRRSASASTLVVDGLSPISQGSIGSQGSSSAIGVLDFGNRAARGIDTSGFTSCAEAKSLYTVQSLPKHTNHRVPALPPIAMNCDRGEKDPITKIAERGSSTGEVEKNIMEEMPCVSTKGEGPNGRRIEGFLYQFQKGKEVRIVCVCHGKFLTPAEFVNHAGGGDVAHPLRHIVVNPSPSAFL